MKKRYEQLIEALCSAASFGAADRIIAGDPFEGSSFSLSSVTGNIVYIESLSIDEANPKTLYEKLKRLSKEAKEWRVTHYIGDVAKQPSRPRGSASHAVNRNFSVRS